MKKWIRRIAIGVPALFVTTAVGAFVWFWGAPVGMTNFINKETVPFMIESPEMLTYVGLDNTPLDFHSAKLADYTEATWDKSTKRAKDMLTGLNKRGAKGLKGQDMLSYEITKWFLEDQLSGEEYRYSSYPINQLSGPQINLPSFLTDSHAIVSMKSAEHYVSRVKEFGRVLD